jgi:hypothetical protein
MSAERPYEITHVPGALHAAFDGRLPPGATGSPEERERNFLTRALAAFALRKLAGCSFDESAAAVVDGGGDGGIDAVHYSPASSTLWLVQAKYIDSGRGEPELGDVAKFKAGIEDLLQGRFDAFRQNAAWSARLPLIEEYLKNTALRVRGVLVYSGVNRVSEDRLRMFEDLVRRFSGGDDYLRVAHYSLTTIHDWIAGADGGPGVEQVHIEILNPGWIREPYETVYGLVRLSAIAELEATHGTKLVAANIRRYKGATEVNERILATLRTEPTHFFYLNNGITAYCDRLEVNNLDRADPEKKRITARGFSIINGAQTVGSVRASCSPDAPDGFVFLKVISLERCLDDAEFARRITESTNFQNQIGTRDFAALDEQQERIAAQLRLDGIEYHYKDAADVPSSDGTNFTLEDATTALACLEQEQTCDLCTRVLANRNSLWSFDEVYPGTDLYRSRYERLFRPDRSARTIWRAVQARKSVIEQMKTEARTATGVRKAFFENARWLVLNIVFLQHRPEAGEALTLTTDELSRLRGAATEIAEAVWTACEQQGHVTRRANVTGGDEAYQQTRHFKSVFCSPADVKRLRHAALADLNGRRPRPASPFPFSAAGAGVPGTGPAEAGIVSAATGAASGAPDDATATDGPTTPRTDEPRGPAT